MFCCHPRLTTLPKGLFSDLGSFRELESRIGLLGEELQRGDAFEVFVEAYLQTHPLFQVKDLWLVGQVPREVRKSLNLPSGQKSIDGVFRTRSGELVPYQVKFRIARPQVTVREVSTFLGLTERAKDRMLISNSDRYAGDIENRDHLRILTGTYFDSLACDELAAIDVWIKGRPARPEPATPRPHQNKAIKDITTALATEDRTTAVMACGTGKTLVGLRVAEAMDPQTVLVLVPSLALLSQALADWCRDTTWGDRLEYLCVCSDRSVSQAADQWTLRSTEAPFPVQTQPKVVRDYLSRPARGKVRLVFSTYQSAPIVAKGMPRGCGFDLAIFDEAHKTAGPHRGPFAFALNDKRLRVRKRLFLTATPRRIDVRHKDRQGEFRVVSMKDATVYGRRAHELSFAEAVSQDIICDYRVVVATVDPNDISAAAIKHGITLVKGDQHATRWVAMQIAVAKAIQETGARKVITFHSRVEQAKHFASDTPKGIQNFLSGFSVGHVSGADPVAVRKEVLAGFKEDRKQLVANARCLTEGVDSGGLNLGTIGSPGVFDIAGLTAGTYSWPSSASLTGVGTLSGNGKSLAVLGTLAPGNSVGTMTVGAGLALDLSNSGSTVFEITDPGYTAGTFDRISGSGSVVFGGVLNLAFSGGSYADGTDVLQIFVNTGGRSGNFSAVNATGLAAGQSATFNPTTGFITVVPEPSTCIAALAGLACGGFSLACRRRAR